MCSECKNNSESGSSFVFGIFLGAIIGAIVAIYIYKNNQSEVFVNLKSKLQKYFSKFTSRHSPHPKTKRTLSKITVTLPKTVETIDLAPTRRSPPKKMFTKK